MSGSRTGVARLAFNAMCQTIGYGVQQHKKGPLRTAPLTCGVATIDRSVIK
jgi:hypothetical protein